MKYYYYYLFGLIICLLFIAGNRLIVEGFNTNNCPDKIFKNDGKLYLYNTKMKNIPGKNPIKFDTLDKYSNFIISQNKKGINCPVLYIQSGKTQTQRFPSMNKTLLVDSTRNDTPYNHNMYPGFDQSSYYVGTTTPLDEMNYEQKKSPLSPDAMDDNWGGEKYTEKLIHSGYYSENEVYKY